MVAASAALLVLITVAAVVMADRFGGQLSLPRALGCVVRADGEVTLDPEQMANAATISAVGIRRGMPAQAVVVALATAYQESGLRNLAGGDRDSVGLFQQRPSQGWGTPEQIRDPRYAANRFYAALVKVRGWERMRVTDAAQRVQRSAFPEAYQKWADEAGVLSRALVGEATGAVSCTVPRDPVLRGAAAATELSSRLSRDWGSVRTAELAELLGLSLVATDQQAGWQYAHWLVAHADSNGVKRVRFAGLQWTAKAGTWSEVADETLAADRVIAEVFGDA
ncbi:hypothetical protein [Plantactinospora sp. GCM10030261]|uniref:hypothetical protein n=1 Tax=Plantactinospora sp. GCM10030261 TaxID=3273420 RepID=UPI0036098F7D